MKRNDKQQLIKEREKNVADNIEFLATINLQEVFSQIRDDYQEIVKLHWDLMEALHIDDNIVYALKHNTIEFGDMEKLESVVEAFDYNNKFLTLLERNEAIYRKVYGDDFFNTKKALAKRDKWRISTLRNGKSTKTTM